MIRLLPLPLYILAAAQGLLALRYRRRQEPRASVLLLIMGSALALILGGALQRVIASL